MAAIYQWYPDGAFLDYEYVLLATDQKWQVKYIGMNYATGISTDFGQLFMERNVDVVSDRTKIYTASYSTPRHPERWVWRGHTFSHDGTYSHGGLNGTLQMWPGAEDTDLIFTGPPPFGQGIHFVNTSGFTWVEVLLSAGSKKWGGVADLNFSGVGVRGYGDAWVTLPTRSVGLDLGGTMVTYKKGGGTLIEQNSIPAPLVANNSGGVHEWGWDVNSGFLYHHTALSGISNTIQVFKVDIPTLTPAYVGTATTVDDVFAVGRTPNGYLVTIERGGTSTRCFRVYTPGTGPLTLLDTVSFIGNVTTDSRIEVSRVSGRMWAIVDGSSAPNGAGYWGTKVFHVEDPGTLVVDFHLPYSIASSGHSGNPISYLETPLNITTNGFVGIKQKLFECWEMDEIGGVTRTGSMGNYDLPIGTGLVVDRVGTIGKAADFDGASALHGTGATLMPQEMYTVSNFGICCDVVLDSKAADQHIFTRGLLSWTGASTGTPNRDFALLYDQALDRFVFYAYAFIDSFSESPEYTAVANNLGSPTIGQKYHIYVEYDKSIDQILIRVDNGTPNVDTFPVGAIFNNVNNPGGQFQIGQRCTGPGAQKYLDGSVDGLYWFWDTLTTDEQTWMYNSGNSRAFSEL